MAESPRGTEVPADEDLLRGIVHPDWWDAESKHVSSAIFAFPKFSAFVASMSDEDELLSRFRRGTGMVRFNCGVARALGFNACHEPEQGNEAHANVYCDLPSSKRKKQARLLVEAAQVTREPDAEALRRADE
jgi:hypothetical protein